MRPLYSPIPDDPDNGKENSSNQSASSNYATDFLSDCLKIDPATLPGIRPIPKSFNRYILATLEPGEYYAKSSNRLLGPFINEPSESELPADEAFVIMRRMGTLPNGGSAFQKIKQI